MACVCPEQLFENVDRFGQGGGDGVVAGVPRGRQPSPGFRPHYNARGLRPVVFPVPDIWQEQPTEPSLLLASRVFLWRIALRIPSDRAGPTNSGFAIFGVFPIRLAKH